MSNEQPEENEWVKPVMKNYLMKCCDCGLVHEIDFIVVKIVKTYQDGTRDIVDASEEYQVMLRARLADT